MGESDFSGSCLLDKVVKMSLASVAGIRSWINSLRSERLVDEDKGSTRVAGSPRPPKVDIRTLSIFEAMVR